MDINMLLYIALIFYSLIMLFGYIFDFKWLYIVAGLLWFIPITQIDNLFIILMSVIMILAHGILGFHEKGEGDF